jgi:hypothetical protein
MDGTFTLWTRTDSPLGDDAARYDGFASLEQLADWIEFDDTTATARLGRIVRETLDRVN